MTVNNIKLKCDRCSGNLSGQNNSAVFFCLVCGRGCDVSGESKICYELKYAQPEKEHELQMEYFPFWHLICDFTIENTSDNTRLEGGDDFLIPAFFIKNINYFGDIGLFYRQKEVTPHFGEKLEIGVFPADRGVNYALKYPYIYLMKEYSRTVGAEFLNIEVVKKEAELVLVPFYKKDHAYFDSILFWKYPSGALI